MTITSADNPRIKAIARLKKARHRRSSGTFLIEGEREVSRAVAAGIDIELLVVCDELIGDVPVTVADADVLHVTAAPMRKIAIREHPPGVIAIARQFDTTLEHLETLQAPLLLVAEGVEKPGNLGAMLRTCDAVGVDGCIVTDPATDVFNPNVVRASQGALFSVPVAVTAVDEVVAWCSARTISVVGGYPEAETALWDVDLTRPVAILIGAEDVGISPDWTGIAEPVRIPMAGTSDSLNASVSAALLLFEALRQRR